MLRKKDRTCRCGWCRSWFSNLAFRYNVYVYYTYCMYMFTGLYSCQREACKVPATFCWALPGETFPQSSVSDRWASYRLVDDAWPEQWQETDGNAHCQACVWDNPSLNWRGKSYQTADFSSFWCLRKSCMWLLLFVTAGDRFLMMSLW